jgi:hypothetical protein
MVDEFSPLRARPTSPGWALPAGEANNLLAVDKNGQRLEAKRRRSRWRRPTPPASSGSIGRGQAGTATTIHLHYPGFSDPTWPGERHYRMEWQVLEASEVTMISRGASTGRKSRGPEGAPVELEAEERLRARQRTEGT